MFNKIRDFFTTRKRSAETKEIAGTESSPLFKPDQPMRLKATYLNEFCQDLDSFVISPEITEKDLKKLCELNKIVLQVSEGWYPMLVNMLLELEADGWDRKVTCIKEKYARLTVYMDSNHSEIIDKYGDISERTCEICGEKGEQRSNSSWDNVACRKHYLESKGTVKGIENGFVFRGKTYWWRNVIDAVFEDQYTVTNGYIKLSLDHDTGFFPGHDYRNIIIHKDTIGYGEFLKSIPRDFKDLDYAFLDEYCEATPCKICGYVAVYGGVCECCDTDESWIEGGYVAYYQQRWIEDDGPLFEIAYQVYEKDVHCKIIPPT